MNSKTLSWLAAALLFFGIVSTKAESKQNMGLTINIYYTGNNGNAIKFAEEMESSGTAAAIRKKPGNIRYEYFSPMNNKETVLLIDSWENQEALDKHHESEIMQKIIELRDKYDLHMQVERYVSEGDKIPDSDIKYIKK